MMTLMEASGVLRIVFLRLGVPSFFTIVFTTVAPCYIFVQCYRVFVSGLGWLTH